MASNVVVSALTVLLMIYVALMRDSNIQGKLALDFVLLSALVVYLMLRLTLERRRRQRQSDAKA